MATIHTSSAFREARERRRLKAGRLFKAGMSQADVALTLRVTPAAVHGWYHAWKAKGMRGLQSKGRTGFASAFTERDHTKLKQAILAGAGKFGYDSDLWTLERIAATMKRVTGKSFGVTWTWHIVTGLGFSPQKPERRSKGRDEAAIEYWQQHTFPRLKKMGAETWLSSGLSG
jgi:transposase